MGSPRQTSNMPYTGELRARGAYILRYHIERPSFAGCEEVNLFLDSFTDALRGFAIGEGERLAEEFSALPRRERAHFSPLFIKGEPCAVFDNGKYISVRYLFVLWNKRGTLRKVERGLVFEAETGRLCPPSEFMRKGQKAPSENFYLTEKGAVFLPVG